MNWEWNVYVGDFNKKEIKTFNIFEHGGFSKDVKKSLGKSETKEEFAKRLKGDLFYYFGSKCEWEVVVTSWTTHIDMNELNRLNTARENTLKEYGREPYSLCVTPDVWKKIDVYDQIRLNWNIFLDMLWSYKKENEQKKRTKKVKCDCYSEEEQIIGWHTPVDPKIKIVYRCNGTRERDECRCGGDRARCDFYPEIREKT